MDANGGHDTFVTQCIFSMPELQDAGIHYQIGRAIAFGWRGDIDGEENRAYCSNNTVYIGDPTAVIRRHHDGEGTPPYIDGVFALNLLVQPDSSFGERLIEWEISENIGQTWDFHDNYYYSVGSVGSAWFKKGSNNRSFTEWMGDSGDETSVQGTAPTFEDAGRDLGQYYDETFSQNGKTSEQFITEKLLTRGRLSWPSNLSADAVIDWFREGFKPTNLPSGTNYGAVPYPVTAP